MPPDQKATPIAMDLGPRSPDFGTMTKGAHAITEDGEVSAPLRAPPDLLGELVDRAKVALRRG
jgi:hypothetical protein